MFIAFDACDLHLFIPQNFVYNMGGDEWISVISLVHTIYTPVDFFVKYLWDERPMWVPRIAC